MSLPIIDGFDNRSNNPLDVKYIVANVAALSGLQFKHKGMWRWVESEQNIYVLQNDLATWKPLPIGQAIKRWLAGSYGEFALVLHNGALFESQVNNNISEPGVGGNWIKILGQKGDPGEPGTNGKSAYQVWLDNGNTGTVSDFLTALRGQDGDTIERWVEGQSYPLDRLVRYGGIWESQIADNLSEPGADSNWIKIAGGDQIGWTPVLAIEGDGDRRVQKVVDWTGGIDPKPAIDQYVGSEGFVATAAEAVDIRGEQGIQGEPGIDAPQIDDATVSLTTVWSSSKIDSRFYTKTETDGMLADTIKPPLPIDCSANPNYPAALKGDSYKVSASGKIGGASGEVVEVQDLMIAIGDTASGDQATVGSNWAIYQTNIDKSTETIFGTSRRATSAEALAGTDDTAYMTAAKVKAFGDSKYTPFNGTGATGTWGIDISGNAATATTAGQWGGYSNNFAASIQSSSTDLVAIAGFHTNGLAYRWNSAALQQYLGGPFLPVANPTFNGTLTGPTANITDRLLVLKNGSNTATSGAWIGLADAGNTRQWLYQLNASYGLDLYHYDANGVYQKYYTADISGNNTWTGNGNFGGSNAGGERLGAVGSIAGYYVSRFVNSSATGLGVYIQNGLDTNPALRISNAAGTDNTIQLYGNGNGTFAGSGTFGGLLSTTTGTIFAKGSGTEGSGYQLDAITMGYDAGNSKGWITAGGAASRTTLALNAGGGNIELGGTLTGLTAKFRDVTKTSVEAGTITLQSPTTAIGDKLGIAFAQTDDQQRARAGIYAVSELSSGYASSIAFYTRNASDGTTLDNTDEKLRITSTGYLANGSVKFALLNSSNTNYLYTASLGLKVNNAADNATLLTLTNVGDLSVSGSGLLGGKVDIAGGGNYFNMRNASLLRWANTADDVRWAYIQHNGSNLIYHTDIGVHQFSGAASFAENVTLSSVSTSASPFDMLTRNISTGTVEKIALSQTVAGDDFRPVTSDAVNVALATKANASAVVSGTYTPTYVNGTGITGTTGGNGFRYSKTGNVYTVSGYVNATTTGTGNCDLTVSLPGGTIAALGLTGIGVCTTANKTSVTINSDSVTNTAKISFTSAVANASTIYVMFQYTDVS